MKKIDSIHPDFGKIAAGWEKWEAWLAPSYVSFNERLMDLAGVRPGASVLDLGSGSGQPALLEAQRAGDKGYVIGIDISDEMLEVARRHARDLKLNNIEFRQQDIAELPFPDESFDSVTARFCLMFLADPKLTLNETCRVLRRGGHFAASVWGVPEKNPLPQSVITQYISLPPESIEAPGPFRFAKTGTLRILLQQSGFVNVQEEEFPIREIFTDGHQYVTHLLESSGTWGTLLNQLEDSQRNEALNALVAKAETFRKNDHLEIPRCAVLAVAEKH